MCFHKVNFELRMYLLEDKVPLSPRLSVEDCRCLAITMNMVLGNYESFPGYRHLNEDERNIFEQSLAGRNPGFFHKPEKTKFKQDPKRPSCRGRVAYYFFKMLHETWVSIIYDEAVQFTKGLVPRVKFVDDSESYAACNTYLLETEHNTVTDEQVCSFCRRCVSSAVFAGSAYGVKGTFGNLTGGYIDVCDNSADTRDLFEEAVAFAQKSMFIVQDRIKDIFNRAPFPEGMDSSRFLHSHCPMVYMFDVGQEIQPLRQDCSLVIAGFSARQYMKHCMQVKKNRHVKLEHKVMEPSGR